MEQPIKSQALEVNLSETQSIKFDIPEEHLWFLSLSKDYWGIHQRTSEFFKELNHPYSNITVVAELLTKLLIDEFWVYKQHEEKERIYNILFGIFKMLIKRKPADKVGKLIIQHYLQFFSTNFEDIRSLEKVDKEFIDILDENLDDNLFSYLINIAYFKKGLKQAAKSPSTEKAVFDFMKKLLNRNVDFWENSTQVEVWYESVKTKLSEDYGGLIESMGKKFYKEYREKINQAADFEELCKYIFTFSEMIDDLRSKINDFKQATDQFTFIFYLLHLSGTEFYRDYILIDLNKAIKRISLECDVDQCQNSMNVLFSLFADFKYSHTSFILESILTLGKEVINTKNKDLIHYFENHTIRFGFINPGVTYLTSNWELKVNPNHIKNIRVWLELIAYDPLLMKKLLSTLIINLRIGGIFIFDSDLFQKDITKFLNADIQPIYKQVKQLLRLFPIYFCEIGAEGPLRDVTTRIDEISHRNDKLIHFLRKQIHTEGSNSHIDITLEIIKFWYDKDMGHLKPIVPDNVYETVDVKGQWVTGVSDLLHKVCEKNNCELMDLLHLEKETLSEYIKRVPKLKDIDIQRVAMIIELYQLLKEKYLFETNDIANILRRYHYIETESINSLVHHIDNNENIEALRIIYTLMKQLNEIIFDPVESEGWENIYYKRHVAFGIPSMYGQYKEVKFEAMGLTFRLERVASILADKIMADVKTDYITARSLKDIFSVIQLFREGLGLDGIFDQGFDSNLKMLQYSLTSGSFTIGQYINIFQFMEGSLKEIISNYFIRPYEKSLDIIILQYYQNDNTVSDKKEERKLVVQHSEMFYRDLLSSAFLLQSLDNFIGEILNNLRRLIINLSDSEIQNIMTYNPDFVISPLYAETKEIDNQVFLGSKAYHLKNLYLNKFPVPPGFVITTEIFRRLNSILKIKSLNNEVDELIKQNIAALEEISGLKFGDSKNPLLLSVRSGAAISMPGAMNTFLNVGLNDEITETLSQQDNFAWTSWDCYRRLLQTWGMAHGLDRNDFDNIMLDYKQKYDVDRKLDFEPSIMREVAFAYKQHLKEKGIVFETDPFKQIKQAIISVFNSWNTDRAKVYRDHMQIAEEWGTAVIIQQMIFGNLHKESGSGVLFTHDIQDDRPGINLCGDFSFLSQGEDIVAGLINTLPISESQRMRYYQQSPFSLESAFPRIFIRLKEIAHDLIDNHGFAHQEIEFTFEHIEPEDLYILQTRDMSIHKQQTVEVFSSPEKEMHRVGCGIGIGNSALNGMVIFDSGDLAVMREKFPESKGILVRPDTVPDDIEMIFECEGLLTGKGGATSHAAVTAGALGKTCVVNCADMIVYEKEKKCVINGEEFHSFDLIAIDGHKGNVYKGNYPVKIQELS